MPPHGDGAKDHSSSALSASSHRSHAGHPGEAINLESWWAPSSTRAPAIAAYSCSCSGTQSLSQPPVTQPLAAVPILLAGARATIEAPLRLAGAQQPPHLRLGQSIWPG
jgi:hypothetical protein